MYPPGHRENPVNVTKPGDLDRAVLRGWDPTPGQAEAGNYRKTHAVIGGLPVTIETPMHRTRRGTGPDGTPWSVTMPAHYGYVKRTTGADGDHVDVYIGPHAHIADICPVWVVDQVDADTRKFDEHKCLLGFPDKNTARDCYVSAFSDGKGSLRIGAVAKFSFPAFKRWLAGNTRDPVAMKSIFPSSGNSCGCGNNACKCQTGSGDIMAAVQTETSPANAGYVTRMFAKALGRMTPAERNDVMRDAAAAATLEIGKATDLLAQGDDHDHPGKVMDLWDGSPDNPLKTEVAEGPDSHAAGGTVNTGKPQEASGAGAARMEAQYSRHAPQHGVQRATEELGMKLAAHGKAMKGFLAFAKAMQDQLTVLHASVSPTAITLDQAAIDKAVAKSVAATVAKAIPEIVQAVSKAKKAAEKDADTEKESGEEDEEDEEDEDDEADQAESGSGTDIEIVNEMDEEDDAEAESDDDAKKAMKKAAARERLISKSLVRLAKSAAAASSDSFSDGRPASGIRQHKAASRRIAKARQHLAIAKSLRGGAAGRSALAIEKALGAVSKAVKETKGKNQDKWPAHGKVMKGAEQQAQDGATAVAGTGTAGTDAAAKANAAQLAAAVDAVNKANAGMALFQADVQKLMTIVGGQSRNSGEPPVSELFKAADLTLVANNPEAAINSLASSGQITMAQRDKAIDALASLKVPGLPKGMIESSISQCPEAVQAILRKAA